jgi:hypothetical protein
MEKHRYQGRRRKKGKLGVNFNLMLLVGEIRHKKGHMLTLMEDTRMVLFVLSSVTYFMQAFEQAGALLYNKFVYVSTKI